MNKRLIIALCILFFVILCDQILKFWIKTNMCLFDKMEITSWFYLFFTENKGMAFGMSFLQTGILALLRLIAVVIFSRLLFREIRKGAPLGFIIALSMIISGALGNIIDNCFYGLVFTESLPHSQINNMPAQLTSFGEGYADFLHGRVVDMFYFPLFRWPDWMPLVGGNTFFGAVFNLADASISVGAAIMLLFHYRYLSHLFSTESTEKNV